VEFSPESRYDWTKEQRWKWLGVTPKDFHLDIAIIPGLWNIEQREYFIWMLDNNELKGKAKKDAELLKNNPQLEWGFK
jgi:hypothetical protein